MKALSPALAFLLCVTGGQFAPLLHRDAKEVIPGEYIVQLSEYADLGKHLKTVEYLRFTIDNGTQVMHTYSIGKSFKGYSIKCGDKMLAAILAMEGVAHVEPNQLYRANRGDCTLQTEATWGIVRTTYRDLPAVEDYSYSSDSGEGVDVYILDTGIETTHPDFGGRAEWGADFVDNPSPRTDLNGHGTHVAGTVMSNTFGLAKKATAIAVRVLDQNGSGTTAGVIRGIVYVAQQHSTGEKSILNMSLGGGFSLAMNYAVAGADSVGIIVVVAAGNIAVDACDVSPASAKEAVTVGATDGADQFAYFSNYGSCVKISGPGVDITSTWINHSYLTISGTSMASPHVAGVFAKYWSQNGTIDHVVLKSKVLAEATPDKIKGLPTSNTPDLLVFKDCI